MSSTTQSFRCLFPRADQSHDKVDDGQNHDGREQTDKPPDRQASLSVQLRAQHHLGRLHRIGGQHLHGEAILWWREGTLLYGLFKRIFHWHDLKLDMEFGKEALVELGADPRICCSSSAALEARKAAAYNLPFSRPGVEGDGLLQSNSLVGFVFSPVVVGMCCQVVAVQDLRIVDQVMCTQCVLVQECQLDFGARRKASEFEGEELVPTCLRVRPLVSLRHSVFLDLFSLHVNRLVAHPHKEVVALAEILEDLDVFHMQDLEPDLKLVFFKLERKLRRRLRSGGHVDEHATQPSSHTGLCVLVLPQDFLDFKWRFRGWRPRRLEVTPEL
mmetsp:Transcript_2327/g.4589  ORF Transcript_2327/g.4589 Transcript_2327/m.4589 type:complete len:329 (-) Transcript_2327:467-1453(-)